MTTFDIAPPKWPAYHIILIHNMKKVRPIVGSAPFETVMHFSGFLVMYFSEFEYIGNIILHMGSVSVKIMLLDFGYF